MIRFIDALNAWGTPDFNDILRREVERLQGDQLPLQQGLSSTSHALDSRISAMIISVDGDEGVIRAKAGIFYTGIVAGCSCADDPTPVTAQDEYCVVLVTIDRVTAGATFVLLDE